MKHDSTGRYWRFDPCGDCDDPDCCEGDSVDVTREIEGLRADLRQLREECQRLAPLWADYTNDVNIGGCVVRAHPCDVDKLTDAWGERDALRAVAIAAAADPFPTPETRTAIYQWWAATNATQDTNADSDRSIGREA